MGQHWNGARNNASEGSCYKISLNRLEQCELSNPSNDRHDRMSTVQGFVRPGCGEMLDMTTNHNLGSLSGTWPMI